MEQVATRRTGQRFSSHDKRLVAIGLTVLAVVSPLYIDRRSLNEPQFDDQPFGFSSCLPLLLLVLITAIAVSSYWDRGCETYDPYWIHRAGGSSVGITVVLMILAFILKCKAATMDKDATFLA
ncbi:hypothetical protein F511_15671 [Dorcoceras hygrometricum]|uniref:Transmembrane protein n=1 Tax=Dorcoceras hygrometricum TaxID=472368 RepID=A0A2Z7BWC6_9LAMI|nr:hypothetical protein F511_15671 [Dorcoceras hygrometricum]